ncbi:MAG: hexokinase, partial [Spirochaetales bacterium]|nr:hexokinase [Spirochaetales bacterium]
MEILGSFIARAAKLTAANLASAVLITDYGKDEDHPVLINADGTTFDVTAYLKSYTTEYLDAFLAEKGRRAVITHISNSPVIGSAIGALTL